jgi:hypothetical protein
MACQRNRPARALSHTVASSTNFAGAAARIEISPTYSQRNAGFAPPPARYIGSWASERRQERTHRRVGCQSLRERRGQPQKRQLNRSFKNDHQIMRSSSELPHSSLNRLLPGRVPRFFGTIRTSLSISPRKTAEPIPANRPGQCQ